VRVAIALQEPSRLLQHLFHFKLLYCNKINAAFILFYLGLVSSAINDLFYFMAAFIFFRCT